MGKMSPGTMILGILAVLFGLVGAYAAKKHFQNLIPQPVAEAPPAKNVPYVPVALVDLPEGRTVAATDITSVRITAEQAAQLNWPGGYMLRSDQVAGRTLSQPVKKGMPFVPDTLFPEGIGPSIASQLGPGERAVTIPFSGSASEAGLITPMALVDVLFRTEANDSMNVPETTVTLLDKVRVLAVGRETLKGFSIDDEKKAAGTGTVTLGVSPVQARALKVVEDRGSLMLVLRHDDANQVEGDEFPTFGSSPTTLPQLLGLRDPQKPKTTDIYRRGHLTTVVYQDGHRQSIEQDPPFGMPVLAQPQQTDSPNRVTRSSGPNNQTVASHSSWQRADGSSTTSVAQSSSQKSSPKKKCCGQK